MVVLSQKGLPGQVTGDYGLFSVEVQALNSLKKLSIIKKYLTFFFSFLQTE